MTIFRWEPFRELLESQQHFNRLFSETLQRGLGDEDLASRSWAPPVDVYETDQNLVLRAELPGIDPKDVEARVEDNTLYLKGERKLENEGKNGNYHRVERAYGTFVRSFSLPGSIDPNRVAAEYKDGILTLTLPKREEAKPRTIQISVIKN